jgi:hypothetical protein
MAIIVAPRGCFVTATTPKQSTVQQTLPDLFCLNQEDVKACLDLLRSTPIFLKKYLSRCHLRILSLDNSTATEEARLTIATSVSAARDLLPSVQVPDFAVDLAECLQVCTRMTFACAVRAMLALVKCECKEIAKFTTWLAYAQSLHGVIEEATKFKTRQSVDACDPDFLQDSDDVYDTYNWIQHICLHPFLLAEVESSSQAFEPCYLTIDGLYCPEEGMLDISGSKAESDAQAPVSFTAARLLKRGVVCRSRNGALSPFTAVLRSMGCKSEPDLADTVLSLNILRLSEDSYIREGKGILLKSAAIQDALSLYRHIERHLERVGEILPAKLRNCLFDALPKRDTVENISALGGRRARSYGIASLHNSRDSATLLSSGQDDQCLHKVVDSPGDLCATFPLLLSDFSFPIGLHSTQVFQNTLQCIVEAMENDPIKLLHPRLCEACPLLCAALGIAQLKERTVTFFQTSLTENIPRSKRAIDFEFNRLLTRKIQLLKVVYIDMQVFIMDDHALRVSNDRKLSACSDLTRSVFLTDSPAHPHAQPNSHIRTKEVWTEVQYLIAGDVAFFRPADKTEVAWRLVLYRLLVQLLVSREGMPVPTAEEEARQAISRVTRDMLDMRDSEGWGSFESTLQMNSSDVEFPTSLAVNDGGGSLGVLAEGGSSSTHPLPATRAKIPYEPSPLPSDSQFGNLRHADLVFRERLGGSEGHPADSSAQGGMRLERLDPRGFAPSGSGTFDTASSETIVDPRAAEWVGRLGERFACLWLQRKYPETFYPTRHWVSSNRLKFYPGMRRGINDALGYDMEVEDTKGLFVANDERRMDYGSGAHRLCFVEVKAAAGKVQGTFYLSRNELRVRERCAELGNARPAHPPIPPLPCLTSTALRLRRA